MTLRSAVCHPHHEPWLRYHSFSSLLHVICSSALTRSGVLCRMWAALQACSRCRGVVVIRDGQCVMHYGIARRGHQPGAASLGPIAKGAISRGTPNYLANLILFPGSSLAPVDAASVCSQTCFPACIWPSYLGCQWPHSYRKCAVQSCLFVAINSSVTGYLSSTVQNSRLQPSLLFQG